MRKVPPLLLFALVSACSFPETRWEKAGSDEKATQNDLVDCRRAARREAFEASPYFAYGPPFWGFRYWDRFESNRFYTENRLTDFCMRNKGYQLVTVAPPQAKQPPTPVPTTDK